MHAAKLDLRRRPSKKNIIDLKTEKNHANKYKIYKRIKETSVIFPDIISLEEDAFTELARNGDNNAEANWFLQGLKNQSNHLSVRAGFHRYWLAALSLLALWFPVDSTGSAFNFAPSGLLINEAVVTGCMIIPIAEEERRKIFKITESGTSLLKLEISRLEELVAHGNMEMGG